METRFFVIFYRWSSSSNNAPIVIVPEASILLSSSHIFSASISAFLIERREAASVARLAADGPGSGELGRKSLALEDSLVKKNPHFLHLYLGTCLGAIQL